ncbi:MAG: alpha/beta hydrolase [Bryobacteraceae bacterium]
MPEKEIVKLELLEIQQGAGENGVEEVRLRTNDGVIPCHFHKSHNGDAAVLFVYRKPGQFIDCVLDVLLGIGFLRNQGTRRIALVGHSFGGSVVINAGVASPAVVAVAALSSQMTGADDIAELSPKPVLLIHGTTDEVRSDIGTRQLYDLAAEPKELLIYPDCGHDFGECREQIDRDLLEWLRRVTPAEPSAA